MRCWCFFSLYLLSCLFSFVNRIGWKFYTETELSFHADRRLYQLIVKMLDCVGDVSKFKYFWVHKQSHCTKSLLNLISALPHCLAYVWSSECQSTLFFWEWNVAGCSIYMCDVNYVGKSLLVGKFTRVWLAMTLWRPKSKNQCCWAWI